MEIDKTQGSQGRPDSKTSRRGLFAAAAVLAVMVSSRKGHALARPPSTGGGGQQCVLRGTKVLTPRGEVNVEDLQVGDLVSTVDGSAKAIKWIGRRDHGKVTSERWAGEVLPIRIARSAIAPMVPYTDLFVSSMHAFYIDGMLVPARNLVNGTSIAYCKAGEVEAVEYFHVELDAHDVIFTNGAATETLLADGERQFDNAPAHGDQTRIAAFAPIVAANRSAILRSRLRTAMSPLIDIRQPGDKVWERLAERGETQVAA